MKLFAVRSTSSFHSIEAGLLVLYAAVASWLAFAHAAWADEAQAWLIARDCSLSQILFERMHYEGTPGLWHLLLWMLTRLGCPYGAMHVLSVAAGVAAAYLVLRYAPFPAPVRWILPFSFAPLFQTAVVARSYSLVPLLGFALCVTMLARKPRPVLVAMLAGLLANTSLIAFCLAAGLVAYYFCHLRGLETKPEKKQLWTAGAVLAVLGLFAIYTAIPAPDQSTGEAHGLVGNHTTGRLIATLTGIPQPKTVAPRTKLNLAPTMAQQAQTGYRQRLGLWLQPPNGHASSAAKLALSTVTWISLLFYPVSSLNLLALAFYVALLVWLATLKRWSVLLPLAFVLFGAKFLPFSEHHSSVLWTGLAAMLWLAWHDAPEAQSRRSMIFCLVLLATLVEQIGWTAAAALSKTPFDGGLQAARFLEARAPGQSVAGFTSDTDAIEPYAHLTFTNMPSSYWPWKIGLNAENRLPEELATHPAFILVSQGYSGNVIWRNQIVQIKPVGSPLHIDQIADTLQAHGYRETQQFCGNQPAHFGFSVTNCIVVFEPVR
jgi:hypothetical protein